MIDPRLQGIPGCEIHPVDAERDRQSAAVLMALDALSALPPRVVCNVIGAHMTDRDDIPHGDLQRLATALDRKAWATMPVEGGV
ncbi:hypothetical protein [Roseovarius amoyensis]|uniref:hypothetical protein n=1 Tax=Roseovarius amoyensis TaxID=2211448 RepID=UPI000DBE29CB|nr:hypothetical protein [Roseovarius amoyensis]